MKVFNCQICFQISTIVNKTLLEKLFGNMIEVSEELDINTTTVAFKKKLV